MSEHELNHTGLRIGLFAAWLAVVAVALCAMFGVYWWVWDWDPLITELEDPVTHRGATVAGYKPGFKDEPRPEPVAVWYPGDTVSLWRRFCQRRVDPETQIDREFVDTIVYQVQGSDAPVIITFPTGCYSASFGIKIPTDLPPKQYRYRAWMKQRINPLRGEVRYAMRAVPLYVVPRPGSDEARSLNERLSRVELQLASLLRALDGRALERAGEGARRR